VANEQEDDDLELAPADAGLLFRAEMATTNFLMGYWKYLVGVLVVVLAAFLFYGQYDAWVTRDQRGTAARIAEVEATLPGPVVDLAAAVAQAEAEGTDPSETLRSAATSLSGIAAEARGAARVEAQLKAAEIYRVLGEAEPRRAALEDAAQHAEGVLKYSAVGALANLALEEGDGDKAVAYWQQLVDSQQGYLAEQALLELGLALEALDRQEEARQAYGDFLTRFPESPRAEVARQRQSRVEAAG
jgi:hypothetical protein